MTDPSTRDLETQRLRLRPIAEEHFEDICLLFADPVVMRFINWGKGRSRAETRERTDSMIRHWVQHGFGMWALFHRQTNAFVGRCGLCYLDNTPDVELGYTLHEKFWGQGLAVEASRACLRFGFDLVGLERIVAIALEENRASTRVMEKLGFTFEGPAHYYKTDVVRYGLRRQTWEAGDALRPHAADR
jgi:ribosomal-protein-alanine N-acetyltransferase